MALTPTEAPLPSPRDEQAIRARILDLLAQIRAAAPFEAAGLGVQLRREAARLRMLRRAG